MVGEEPLQFLSDLGGAGDNFQRDGNARGAQFAHDPAAKAKIRILTPEVRAPSARR